MKKKLIYTFLFTTITGQVLAQENSKVTLQVCGQRIGAVIYLKDKKDPEIKDFVRLNKEHCDNGEDELNANYQISLYNKDKKEIYSKKLFIQEQTLIESFSKDGEIKLDGVIAENSRAIAFPEQKSLIFNYYSVKRLSDNKSYSIQKISKIEDVKVEDEEAKY